MNQTSENKTGGVEGVFGVTDIILTVVDAALIVIIAVGNSLTLVAVCRFKRLRSPTGVAIATLAVADLIMGIVYTPLRFMHTTWPSMFASRATCIVYIFVVHFTASCAVIGLSLLSTERGYAIQFPMHYQTYLTTKCSVVISLCVFAAIFCLNLPFLSGMDHYNGQDCYSPILFPKAYLRTLIAIGVAVLLLGFVAFVRVLVEVFRRQKSSNVLSGQQLKQQISSVRCRLMCAVYVSSLVCWLPHLTYYFYNTFTKQTRNVFVFRILSISDLCSSAVNFFIYGVMNINFRMAYKQILGLDKQGRRTSTDVSATTVTHFDDVAV